MKLAFYFHELLITSSVSFACQHLRYTHFLSAFDVTGISEYAILLSIVLLVRLISRFVLTALFLV